MPQILMLNHAAHVQTERRDAKIKSGRHEERTLPEKIAESLAWNGKPVSELTSEEYIAYHSSAMV